MKNSRKEDYLLGVTIKTDTLQLDDVVCRVFLPVRLTDPISLTFHLTDEQVRVIHSAFFWKFSLRGELVQPDNSSTKIHADYVYTSNLRSTLMGKAYSENVLIATPVDLEITKCWPTRVSEKDKKTYGSFWLTPNEHLTPAQMVTTSHTGEVKVKTVWSINLPLTKGMLLTFSNCYKYQNDEAGDTVSFPELVAEFEISDNSIDSAMLKTEQLGRLDDLLRLVSLAARHRCACLGFDVSSSGCYSQYYRRELTIPKAREPHITVLIEKENIKEFLEWTYQKFIELGCNELLRQALNYAIPDSSKTVESSFISLYSALETLVLYFRKSYALEMVFSENEAANWKQLHIDLKEWLRNHSLLKNHKDKRKLIYENLSALRRISFPTAFRECCRVYSLDLEDLWPVVDNSEGWSLSTIRNKLVHGEHLIRPQSRAVLAAREHLQWIVERLILAIFGWDVSRSDVCPGGLSHKTQYQNWKADREILSL